LLALLTKQKDFIADNSDSEAIHIIEYIQGKVNSYKPWLNLKKIKAR